MTVLDVGCGPRLPYRAPHAYVIGLDPSADSLAANTDVDDRIVGSAVNIPLDDASVDLVVAMYALHHVLGCTPANTVMLRETALAEMARVVRPGGEILVFEVTPWPVAALLQHCLWGTARRVLGDRLAAYFWTDAEYARTPLGSPEVQTFSCSPWATFPPIFALPWLRVPRFLFPFDACLYRWRIPDGN